MPSHDLSDTWLFFEDDQNERLVVRKEYSDLQCSCCGKINEDEAIRRGISQNFIVKSSKDWMATSEGWICVSGRFREFVSSEHIDGLNFIESPGNVFVIRSNKIVATDEQIAGFENHGLCNQCGRYRERLVGPLVASLAVPKEDRAFFASEIQNENARASYRTLFATPGLVKVLRKEKFKGLSIVEAF